MRIYDIGPFRDGETTIRINVSLFEGGGLGGREENPPNAVFFSRGKRHDNKILKVQILLSRNFVVIAQAPTLFLIVSKEARLNGQAKFSKFSGLGGGCPKPPQSYCIGFLFNDCSCPKEGESEKIYLVLGLGEPFLCIFLGELTHWQHLVDFPNVVTIMEVPANQGTAQFPSWASKSPCKV